METEILRRPVVGPSVWKREDYGGRVDWVWSLDDAQRGELDKLLRAGPPRRADFPALGGLLARTWRELRDGRGFVVLRGFPVDDYTVPEIERMYLALGSLMGTPVSQNSYGDVLGHVRDEGKRYRATGDIRGARGYLRSRLSARRPMHARSIRPRPRGRSPMPPPSSTFPKPNSRPRSAPPSPR